MTSTSPSKLNSSQICVITVTSASRRTAPLSRGAPRRHIGRSDGIVLHAESIAITMFPREARFTFYYFNICHDKFLPDGKRVLQIGTLCIIYCLDIARPLGDTTQQSLETTEKSVKCVAIGSFVRIFQKAYFFLRLW